MKNDEDEQRSFGGGEIDLTSMSRMPKVPDMSGKLDMQRRSPFVMTDFGGSSPANITKP